MKPGTKVEVIAKPFKVGLQGVVSIPQHGAGNPEGTILVELPDGTFPWFYPDELKQI